MRAFLMAIFLAILFLALMFIGSTITESAELSEDIRENVQKELLSPIPLLQILTREKKLNNNQIYVISLTPLKESNEIVAMYMESSGCLVVVVYGEGDKKKRANELYQYDAMIPPKKIRQYYVKNAPTAEFLLEKFEQRERERQKRNKK